MKIGVRGKSGVVKEGLDLETAIDHFLSEDGYRLDFMDKERTGRDLFVRRESKPKIDLDGYRVDVPWRTMYDGSAEIQRWDEMSKNISEGATS